MKKIKEFFLKKRQIKKLKIGFTLVELLAVIVILGILILLAVPATQNVIKNARVETFKQYTLKVKNLVQQKLQEEDILEKSQNSDTGCYIYNIKTDLGLANTGEYKGYYAIVDRPRFRGLPIQFKHQTYIQDSKVLDERNVRNDLLAAVSVDPYYDYYDFETINYLLLWNKDYFIAEKYTDDGEIISSFVQTYKQFKNTEPGKLLESDNILGAVKIFLKDAGARCSYDTTTNKDNTPDEEKEAYISSDYLRYFLEDNVGQIEYYQVYQFNDFESFNVNPLNSLINSNNTLNKLISKPIYEHKTLYSFKRYHGDNPIEKYDISESNSNYPVYIWVDEDTDTIYYYSEAPHVFITNASYVFESLYLKSVDLSEIDLSKSTNFRYMFADSIDLETVDFGNNNLARAFDVSYMFSECVSLKNIYVNNNWNLNNVYNSEYMFMFCENLPNYNEDNSNDHTFATIDKYLTKR